MIDKDFSLSVTHQCRLPASPAGEAFNTDRGSQYPLKPVTGENVRAHVAGMYQQGLLRNPSTYAVGDLSRFNVYPERFVLSRHSGQAGIQAAVRRYAGLSVEGAALETLREKVKAKAGEMTSLGITELLTLLAEQGLLSASLWRCSAFRYEESQTGNGLEIRCSAELQMDGIDKTYTAMASDADDAKFSWSAPLVALLIQAAGTPVQIRTISVTGYQGKCRPGKVRVYLEASANARIYALERTGPCRERLLLDLLLDTWLTRKERSVVHPAFKKKTLLKINVYQFFGFGNGSLFLFVGVWMFHFG